MATYATLDDLKRILLSTRGEKIRSSSNSLVSIRVGQLNNNGGLNRNNYPTVSFNKAEVVIESSFVGNITLEVKFSSPTDFSVYLIEAPQDLKEFLGTGDINTDFTTNDGSVTLNSAGWIGTPTSLDVVTFRFQSHLSDDHVEDYIEQAETMIDATLKDYGLLASQTEGAELLFDLGSVPNEIAYATSYYAAYFIFTDVYMEVLKDDSDATLSLIHRHKKRAEEFLKKYFNYSQRTPPRLKNYPLAIDRIGDPVVGPGLEKKTSDRDTLARDARTDDIFKE